MRPLILLPWILGSMVSQSMAAITLDITSQDSIKQAASKAAAGMVQYYTGYRPGDVPGNLPAPYYWYVHTKSLAYFLN